MALARVRRFLPFLTVAVVLGLLYDGWLFYSRWSSNREVEQQRATKEAEEARRTLDMMGGGNLKILNFYASPPTVKRGGHTNLCYSVVGATSVRMEPAVEKLNPAFSYCLQVSPQKDTEYTLFAEDAKGHKTSDTAAVSVR